MSSSPRIYDLKADSFSFPTLFLLGSDLDLLFTQLQQQVQRAPDFFNNTPLVIDLSRHDGNTGEVDFPLLVGLLRGLGILPIGVRGGSDEQQEAAERMELARLADSRARAGASERRAAQPPQQTPPEPSPEADPPRTERSTRDTSREPTQTVVTKSPGMLITRPVRSGQKIYAAGTDLIVVAPVSSGAELMADGSIHVYGSLRGRALAGAAGNAQVRVFCQNLQAELVSVAGRYILSEDYPTELINKPVQAWLDGDRLRLAAL